MICLKPQREPGGDKNRGGVLWPVPGLLVLAASQTALFYVHPVLASPWCYKEPSSRCSVPAPCKPAMSGLGPEHRQGQGLWGRVPRGQAAKASRFDVGEVWAGGFKAGSHAVKRLSRPGWGCLSGGLAPAALPSSG